MAEPVEVETQEAVEVPAAKVEAELPKEAETAPEAPKEAAKAPEVPKEAVKAPEVPKEAEKAPELPGPPEEIILQTPDGPVTFSKKRPVGRPKKAPKELTSKAAPRKKAEKKVVVETAPPEEVAPQAEKENEPPPAPPLVRLSGREKLEEHMRIMQQLRCDAKESQRVKYRAMLRA